MEDGTDRQTSSPPDWNLVQFDVGCARCGHDLRGFSDPTCPDCGLEFDWSDAVPLEELTCLHCGYHLYGLNETRCPECGKSFTWEEALAAYHRRKKVVFEYSWREKPIRSLFSTWWLAIRPRKLWRVIDMHDPPQVKPLLAMLAAVLVAIAIVVPLLWATSGWIAWRSGAWLQGAPPVLAIRVIPQLLADIVSSPALWCLYLAVTLWWGMSFVALLIFRQSMNRYRVRTVQVMRVCAYAFLAVLPSVPVVVTLAFLAQLLFANEPISGLVVIVWLVLAPVWAILLIRAGYKSYLRMPHGLAVAIASQVIALLAIAVVIANITLL